jgi:hypothetical protein
VTLVAILAHVDRSDPVATYGRGVLLIIAFFAGAGVVAASLLTARVASPASPASGAPAITAIAPAPVAVPVPGADQRIR